MRRPFGLTDADLFDLERMRDSLALVHALAQTATEAGLYHPQMLAGFLDKICTDLRHSLNQQLLFPQLTERTHIMNTQLMPVPFHGDTVVLVGKDNEPYVAMRPIVENMGLGWSAQRIKIVERFDSVVSEINTTGADGKQYGMTCLPLRKLAAWLYSISPNKVAPELRDKIVQYQEECDEVLWNYWTKGAVVRPGAITIAQQISLSKHRLVLLKELMRSRNRSMRDLLGVEITNLSNSMGLPVPDLDALGTVEPPQADLVADFWGALLQLDTKGIVYNHSKDPQLIALNMPHLVELFAGNGIQTIIGTDVTNALKRCTEPQFLGQKAVDSIIRKTTTKCWVFKKVTQIQAQ